MSVITFMWTEDDLAYVRQLAAAKESATGIAHALSIRLRRQISRNSVIGVCRRRGIPLGGKTYRNLPRTAAIELVNSAKKPVEAKTPRQSKGAFVFGRRLTEAAPTPVVEDPLVIPDAMPIGVSLMDLDRDACRYPLGDPRSDDFRFCGDLKKPGSSYCAGHHALCYVAQSSNATKRTLFRELVG